MTQSQIYYNTSQDKDYKKRLYNEKSSNSKRSIDNTVYMEETSEKDDNKPQSNNEPKGQRAKNRKQDVNEDDILDIHNNETFEQDTKQEKIRNDSGKMEDLKRLNHSKTDKFKQKSKSDKYSKNEKDLDKYSKNEEDLDKYSKDEKDLLLKIKILENKLKIEKNHHLKTKNKLEQEHEIALSDLAEAKEITKKEQERAKNFEHQLEDLNRNQQIVLDRNKEYEIELAKIKKINEKVHSHNQTLENQFKDLNLKLDEQRIILDKSRKKEEKLEENTKSLVQEIEDTRQLVEDTKNEANQKIVQIKQTYNSEMNEAKIQKEDFKNKANQEILDIREELKQLNDDLSASAGNFNKQIDLLRTKLKEEIITLQQQITDLQTQLYKAQETIKNQEETTAESINKNAELQKEYEALQRKLTGEKEDMQIQIDNLQHQRNSDADCIRKLETMIETEIKKSNDLSIRLQKDEEFEKEKEDNRQESLQKAAQEVAKVTEELNEQSSKINLMENNMKIQRNLFIQQRKNNDTKVFTLYKQITEGEIQIKKQAKSIKSLQNQIKQLTNNMEQLRGHIETLPTDIESQKIFYNTRITRLERQIKTINKIEQILDKIEQNFKLKVQYNGTDQQNLQNLEECNNNLKTSLEEIKEYISPEILVSKEAVHEKIHINPSKLQDILTLFQQSSNENIVGRIENVQHGFHGTIFDLRTTGYDEDKSNQILELVDEGITEIRRYMEEYRHNCANFFYQIVCLQFREIERIKNTCLTLNVCALGDTYPNHKDELQKEGMNMLLSGNYDLENVMNKIKDKKFREELTRIDRSYENPLIEEIKVTYEKINKTLLPYTCMNVENNLSTKSLSLEMGGFNITNNTFKDTQSGFNANATSILQIKEENEIQDTIDPERNLFNNIVTNETHNHIPEHALSQNIPPMDNILERNHHSELGQPIAMPAIYVGEQFYASGQHFTTSTSEDTMIASTASIIPPRNMDTHPVMSNFFGDTTTTTLITSTAATSTPHNADTVLDKFLSEIYNNNNSSTISTTTQES